MLPAVMEAKYKLDILLKELNYKDENSLVENGLRYFRQCYTERPNKYPGDAEYYDLFKRAILKGLNLSEAFDHAKKIIDREMVFLDRARAAGISHAEWWFD